MKKKTKKVTPKTRKPVYRIHIIQRDPASRVADHEWAVANTESTLEEAKSTALEILAKYRSKDKQHDLSAVILLRRVKIDVIF